MGGDTPPSTLLQAVLEYKAKLDPSVTLVVISQEKPIEDIEFLQADDVIRMDESPLYAVRKKKNSSIGVGIRALLEGKIDALVTTGNTGALVAFASLYLPRLPQMQRPALLAVLPTAKGRVAVLDVGANIAFKSSQLLDYAKFGAYYRESFDQIVNPRIGLLNIGQEEQKGTPEIKEAYAALQAAFPKQFVGNIEGREVFEGKVDVLVTDGFTGNVFLKTCEGASSFLLEYLQKYFANEPTKKVLTHFHQTFNYAEHPGAILAGVDGLVIKCHGYSNTKALQSGIEGAIKLLQKDVLGKIKLKLHQS